MDLEGAWRELMVLGMRQGSGLIAAGAELGLTPPHVKALLSLDPDEPRPMRWLAEEFRCDASFVTAIVDRLEERHLVERRPHATDRRVKVVAITAEGMKAKAFAESVLFRVPDELTSLPLQDQEALERIAEHLRRVRMGP